MKWQDTVKQYRYVAHKRSYEYLGSYRTGMDSDRHVHRWTPGGASTLVSILTKFNVKYDFKKLC